MNRGRVRGHTLWRPASGHTRYGVPAGGLTRALMRPVLTGLGLGSVALLTGYVLHHPLYGAAAGAALFLLPAAVTPRQRGRLNAGAEGERLAAQTLRRMPDATALYDLMVGKENVDAVLVTDQGVFSIEVKHWANIEVDRRGLHAPFAEAQKVPAQARRQAVKLAAVIGQNVTPVIVWTHPTARIRWNECDGVRCCALPALPATLTRLRREGIHPVAPRRVPEVVHQLARLMDR